MSTRTNSPARASIPAPAPARCQTPDHLLQGAGVGRSQPCQRADRPSVSTAIDYEAELAVIIGKGGRGISKEDALDHVWGYTIVNDVTARDLQGKYSQWLIGKSQDTFCPMGPWAVTRDEFDLANAGIRCFVNEDLRQWTPGYRCSSSISRPSSPRCRRVSR
ncbi:fumarylacetoacetate hydrolase family protein [Mesorhizobium atlanticum]